MYKRISFTGKCPTQKREYTIKLDYNLVRYNGWPTLEKGFLYCDYIRTGGTCGFAVCPIYRAAPQDPSPPAPPTFHWH